MPHSGCSPPCEFEGFWVDGKSLTIVFDTPLGPAGTYHFPGIGVRNLLPGQRVVLRGLRRQPQGTAGIWLEDNAGSVWIEDCLLSGGVGNGSVGLGGCTAPGGIDFDTAPGSLFVYPGDSRSFELPSPLRVGESGALAIAGVSGDFVACFWSFGHDLLPKPGKNGWFLLGAPFIAGPFLIGAISDPDGEWNVPITGPNLPPAAEAQTFLLQAYFAYTGGVTLRSGSAFTLVDAAC